MPSSTAGSPQPRVFPGRSNNSLHNHQELRSSLTFAWRPWAGPRQNWPLLWFWRLDFFHQRDVGAWLSSLDTGGRGNHQCPFSLVLACHYLCTLQTSAMSMYQFSHNHPGQGLTVFVQMSFCLLRLQVMQGAPWHLNQRHQWFRTAFNRDRMISNYFHRVVV